ncbi:phosphatidic acid phosphatase type 2/haloperoxidase [Vararia minispora EC-137]|uniref:Phosphatidic acid phosphatase type 2/haloperoxidase n=1 Tax=Vararia minispora EC-137 TaxID=1314806 RepID=A0ACB8QMR1_9AGAM|nr:phosphatidic acid phosphatase type 2/haloperoxidase [Vararia minispora EC-137]
MPAGDTAHKRWSRQLRTNITVTGATGAFLLYTRSAGVAWFAMGAVACSLTVKVLKRLIRQDRPDPILRKKKKKSYGMPSTHSASMAFFATYIPLACAYLPIHSSLPDAAYIIVLPPFLIIPCAMLVTISRTWLGHHTWPQVLVGCSYGVAFALLWYNAWIRGVQEYGAIVEDMVREYIGK